MHENVAMTEAGSFESSVLFDFKPSDSALSMSTAFDLDDKRTLVENTPSEHLVIWAALNSPVPIDLVNKSSLNIPITDQPS